MKKFKILCIDIEGGHGGSSRSLFYFLEAISKKKKFSQLEITVICRKKSWVEKKYKNIGINCLIEEHMPRYTPLKKNSRNIYQLILFLIFIWPRSNKFRKRILTLKHYDVLHFNHVSLSLLAWWCKLKKIGKTRVMHIRTMPPKNIFSKILYTISKKSCDSFIYITENEKNHLHHIIGQPNLNEKVIYNPVKILKKNHLRLLKNDNRFKIGILSNFSYNRGLDRTLEIFEAIPLHKKKMFVFVFGGDMTLEKNMPNINKSFIKEKKYFSEVVASSDYKENFIFLGQLKHPERLLQSIHVLLKPTRLNNPWGRDILEALSQGKPAISIGNYEKFIETDLTGLLQRRYDPTEIANWLLKIESDKTLQKKFSIQCKKRIEIFCNPTKVSNMLLNVWSVK